jgi:TonB family protein
MNRSQLTTLLVFISSLCFSQTSETKYYNQRMEEVSPEKAKFSKTITQGNDGSITTSTKDIKKNLITSSQTLIGDEPFGVWIYQRAKGTGELDYNFELNYSKEVCSNEGDLVKLKNYFNDNDVPGYKSPILATGHKSIYESIGQNIIYPAKARRFGIQGVVMTSFIITKEGNIENIVVNKGVDLVIDKEAVRVLRLIKYSSPPMLNGEPVTICVKLPITFRLG